MRSSRARAEDRPSFVSGEWTRSTLASGPTPPPVPGPYGYCGPSSSTRSTLRTSPYATASSTRPPRYSSGPSSTSPPSSLCSPSRSRSGSSTAYASSLYRTSSRCSTTSPHSRPGVSSCAASCPSSQTSSYSTSTSRRARSTTTATTRQPIGVGSSGLILITTMTLTTTTAFYRGTTSSAIEPSSPYGSFAGSSSLAIAACARCTSPRKRPAPGSSRAGSGFTTRYKRTSTV